jgi:hypothetical protein
MQTLQDLGHGLLLLGAMSCSVSAVWFSMACLKAMASDGSPGGRHASYSEGWLPTEA